MVWSFNLDSGKQSNHVLTVHLLSVITTKKYFIQVAQDATKRFFNECHVFLRYAANPIAMVVTTLEVSPLPYHERPDPPHNI